MPADAEGILQPRLDAPVLIKGSSSAVDDQIIIFMKIGTLTD